MDDAPLSPDRLLDHCSWLRLGHVDRIIAEWRLVVSALPEGGMYFRIPGRGDAVLCAAPSIASATERAVELILGIPRDFSRAN